MTLVKSLPNTVVGRAIAGQIIRSGSSVAANYRAACRARSRAEFVSKLGVVEEEADETAFWLEMIIETGLLNPAKVNLLLVKANAIVAMMASSKKTAAKLQIANCKSAIR